MNVGIDKLTGLFNQKAFEEMLSIETSRSIRYKRPYCLLMVEVHFDYFVHDYDIRRVLHYAVMKQLATLVTEGLRKIDVAARYSGENLVCLLPETPEGGGLIVAERMRQRVDGTHLTGDEKQPTVKVALNIGLAVSPIHGKTPREILSSAQKAMLIARSEGGNKVVVFPDQLHHDFPTLSA